MWGRHHDPTQEPDPHIDALVNHAADVSAAADMGLITAADIRYTSFELALVYRAASAEKRAKGREGKGKPGKHVNGGAGLAKFLAAAKKAKGVEENG